MAKSMKRVGGKQPPHTEGFLESAAQAIGSTLGSIAAKTGFAKPEIKPTAKIKKVTKKSPARAPAAKTSRPET